MHDWALLLIDIQRDFHDEISPYWPEYGERVAQLLALCREAGLLIVHVRVEFSPDRSDWMIRYRDRGWIPCVAGTPGAEVMEYARPLSGEITLVKKRFSAFFRTPLDAVLRQRNVNTLVIGGLVTSICVALTVVDAYQHDYVSLVVRDCVADEPERHEMALRFMSDFVADVITLDGLRAKLASWRK